MSVVSLGAAQHRRGEAAHVTSDSAGDTYVCFNQVDGTPTSESIANVQKCKHLPIALAIGYGNLLNVTNLSNHIEEKSKTGKNQFLSACTQRSAVKANIST